MMEENKNPRSHADDSADAAAHEAHERREDATSGKTLSEVEETEKVSTNRSGAGESSGGVAPSPDGTFDGSRSEGDAGSDPGPM